MIFCQVSLWIYFLNVAPTCSGTDGPTVDAIDRRLLALLQSDARLGYQELADAVGLSAPAAFQRVRKLRDRGVLTGFHARVDPLAAGLQLVAFVRVRPGPGTNLERLEKSWRAAPEVMECHRVSGDGGYLLKLRLSEPAQLAGYLDAARTAGCAVLADLALATVVERWTVPVRS